jgi:conjugal transfer pilus assembly protein TraV
MKRFVVIAMILIHLTACTTMNSGFDCPNKAGVSCKSLDQINSMVDSGDIRGRTQMNSTAVTANVTENTVRFSSVRTASSPTRHGETVQRIWIVPYEDSEGNYHQDHFIHAVMNSGHWGGKPVKAIHSL